MPRARALLEPEFGIWIKSASGALQSLAGLKKHIGIE